MPLRVARPCTLGSKREPTALMAELPSVASDCPGEGEALVGFLFTSASLALFPARPQPAQLIDSKKKNEKKILEWKGNGTDSGDEFCPRGLARFSRSPF